MALTIDEITATVNGETVALAALPKVTKGQPTVETTTQTVGTTVEPIATRDFSTAIGKMTLTLKVTLENQALVDKWEENVGENEISFTNGQGLTQILKKASVAEPPEFDYSSGNDVEINFEGARID